MSNDSSQYMVEGHREDTVSRKLRFEHNKVYCCFVHYRKYFVIHCGLIQVIQSYGNFDRVESRRGEPVVLCNLSDEQYKGLYQGSIEGPIEVSMTSRFVIDGHSMYEGYPKRDSEELWQMNVYLRYYFPNYAAEGQPLLQTGWVIVPYALADALARWIAQHAPAVQVEWRLPGLID
jgi:hypothetical protein